MVPGSGRWLHGCVSLAIGSCRGHGFALAGGVAPRPDAMFMMGGCYLGGGSTGMVGRPWVCSVGLVMCLVFGAMGWSSSASCFCSDSWPGSGL